MGFDIINGRNHGYPCIPELNERDDIGLEYPVCQFMFIAEGGYPSIFSMPEALTSMVKPVPKFMMRCFGKLINGGLPWIEELKEVRKNSFSSLYFGSRQVKGLNFGEQELKSAYCSGTKVFGEYYDRGKIV